MACYSGGFEYSEGSLICSNGRELRCSGGAWQETGYSCVQSENDEHLRIDPDGQTIRIIAKDSVGAPYAGYKSQNRCVRVVNDSNTSVVKFYNSCEACMVVVMSWFGGQVSRVAVQPKNFAVIQRESIQGDIIDEYPCSLAVDV
jgi:hypothetical protein